MTSFVEFIWRGTVAVGIPLIVVLVTTVSPLRGEMCSALVSASDDGGIEDLTTLQARAFAAFRSACRKPDLNYQSCMFNTTPSTPMSFKFILGPVSMPFKMRFDIKASGNALVALAENKTHDSIFAQITIGGWWNGKSAVRACLEDNCPNLQVEHDENDLLSEAEYRPFWIEYDGGVVTVGKGGQIEGFLDWNAGAYQSRIPSQVYVGISTWREVSGSWVFYHFCE